MKVLLVYPNLQMMQLAPPNIAVLSAYLKSKGIEVELFDTTFYKTTEKSADDIRVELCQVRPFDLKEKGITYKQTDLFKDLIKHVSLFRPRVIAISTTDFTKALGIDIAERIKQVFSCVDIRIIMGGIYPTFSPNEAIMEKSIDAICIGEGEEALYEYVCNDTRTDIKNLWIKKNGNIYRNILRPPCNLDKLPFDDYTIFGENRLYRPMQGSLKKMLPLQIDRGCPYSCTFCAAESLREMYKKDGWNYLRRKSVDRIIKELTYQENLHHPDYIYFNSETFLARSAKHIETFAEVYSIEFGIPFWCETRVETIIPRYMKWLRLMKCDRLSIGLESGNEEYRTSILQKKFSNKTFIQKLRIAQDHGIRTTINNIIGFPNETREMIFDTIELNREAINHIVDTTINIAIFIPYGGSKLRQTCFEKGYIQKEDFENLYQAGLHTGNFFLRNQLISPKELKGLFRTFPLYVRMPKSTWKDIQIAEQDDNVFKNLKKIFWKEYFKPLK